MVLNIQGEMLICTVIKAPYFRLLWNYVSFKRVKQLDFEYILRIFLKDGDFRLVEFCAHVSFALSMAFLVIVLSIVSTSFTILLNLLLTALAGISSTTLIFGALNDSGVRWIAFGSDSL